MMPVLSGSGISGDFFTKENAWIIAIAALVVIAVITLAVVASAREKRERARKLIGSVSLTGGVVCPGCGMTLKREDPFCPHCGRKVGTVPVPAAPKPKKSEAPKEKKYEPHSTRPTCSFCESFIAGTEVFCPVCRSRLRAGQVDYSSEMEL